MDGEECFFYENYYNIPTVWIQRNKQAINIREMSVSHIKNAVNVVYRRMSILEDEIAKLSTDDFISIHEIEKELKLQTNYLYALKKELESRGV